jgi:hypothetical protein
MYCMVLYQYQHSSTTGIGYACITFLKYQDVTVGVTNNVAHTVSLKTAFFEAE